MEDLITKLIEENKELLTKKFELEQKVKDAEKLLEEKAVFKQTGFLYHKLLVGTEVEKELNDRLQIEIEENSILREKLSKIKNRSFFRRLFNI